MAGELTHIIPTHPSDPAYKARQTRQIIYVDPNGTQHNIIAVYWSPTNNVNDRKLIWQLSNDVPYDNTCTATITLSQDKTAWIVSIEKDGENVTSSLSQITTWIYDGKGERVNPQRVYTNTIDLSQKPRGDYRVDLAQITSKAGGYFPGTGVISVPEHIYIGNLVTGDKNVAIEYVPTNDITINTVEIFTSQTGTETGARFNIIHESGLYIATANGNTVDSNKEVYNLNGKYRIISNLNITLYKDKVYYFVFNDSNVTSYYPTFFENETGNYIENFTDTNAPSSPYQNVNNLVGFLPTGINPYSTGYILSETDLQTILSYNTNDLFLWNGSNLTDGSNNVIRDDHLGKKLTSSVVAVITSSDADIWNYTQNQYFIRHNYGNNVSERVWRKKETTNSNGTFTISAGSASYQHAQILLALGNDTTHKVLASAPDHVWTNYVNQLVNIKSGYIVDSTLSLTPLDSLPTGVDKHFYYISGSAWTTYHETAIYVYENGQFNYINAYGNNDMKNYLDFKTLDSTIEQISVSSLVQEDVAASCNSDVVNATKSTNRKYYLRINGKEV